MYPSYTALPTSPVSISLRKFSTSTGVCAVIAAAVYARVSHGIATLARRLTLLVGKLEQSPSENTLGNLTCCNDEAETSTHPAASAKGERLINSSGPMGGVTCLRYVSPANLPERPQPTHIISNGFSTDPSPFKSLNTATRSPPSTLTSHRSLAKSASMPFSCLSASNALL